MLLTGGCRSMVFGISSACSIGQRLLSEREDVQSMKTKPIQMCDWAGFMTRASRHLKPTCRFWSGISLPNSSPITGSSTPVPSGNGGGENCISVSATAHMESSPQCLQNKYNVSCDDLADYDLGAGSGWQQSKQHKTPPAEMRY
jgi:hypothetical protein